MGNISPVGRLFPNLTRAIASYDPATQITIFEEISNARREELFSRPPKEGDERDLSVIAHEFRHCLDHLCTLWGQRHLLKLQRALTAVLNINQHFPVIEIEDLDAIFSYKEEESRAFQWNISNPVFAAAAPIAKKSNLFWIDLGVTKAQNERERVNNGNLMFKTNFYADKEKHLIVSLPLNVITLLELNALAEEERIKFFIYKQIYKPEEMNFQYYVNSPDKNSKIFNY